MRRQVGQDVFGGKANLAFLHPVGVLGPYLRLPEMSSVQVKRRGGTR
jgi:hypothetical protein